MLEIKNEKNSELVGLVTTLFSEQMIKNSYNVKQINENNYKNVISYYQIKTVFIDNDIYENDHSWYETTMDEFLQFLYDTKIDVYVIKNTTEEINPILTDNFIIEINANNEDISILSNKMVAPILLNEFIFNPSECKKEVDVLYYSVYPDPIRTPQIKLFNKEHTPVFEELFTDGISKESLNTLIEKIKISKVLYIYYDPEMDYNILNYIVRAATLLNTYVVLDSDYVIEVKYSFNSGVDKNNTGQMRVVKNSGLYKDKQVLHMQRQVFLKNTFLTISTFERMIRTRNVERRTPEISVITSTNRAKNLPHYVNQMNRQKHVKLQVVLLTHGFELKESQKEALIGDASIEYKFLSSSSDISLGNCLNKCIDHSTFPTITKVDDDDYYLENYLIDQWIALNYSRADVVGKAAQFIYIEKENMIVGRNLDRCYQYDRFVMGATLMGSSNLVKSFMFSDLPKAVDTDFLKRVRKCNGVIYQNFPYDFCIFRAENKTSHTWRVDDLDMVKAGEILSYGNPEAYISAN